MSLLSMPSLQTWRNLSVTGTNLRSLDLPALVNSEWISISNNPFLTNITFRGLTNFSGSFIISDNPRLTSIELPSLTRMDNNTLAIWSNPNLTSLIFPELSVVADVDIWDNMNLKFFEFPKLKLADRSIVISDNIMLLGFDFPSLTTINSDLMLANNTALLNVTAFQKLSSLGWDLDLTGCFDTVSLPAIKSIGRRVNIQSSSDVFQCPFPEIENNGVTTGRGFICSGGVKNPQYLYDQGNNTVANSDIGSTVLFESAQGISN
jgi:hypothetical protein